MAGAVFRPRLLGGLSGGLLSRKPAASQFRKIEPMALLACAGFFAAGSTFYLTALEGASVANVSCLTASRPVFAALLAWIFSGTGRRPDLAGDSAGHRRHAVIFMDGCRLGSAEPRRQWDRLATAFCFAGQTVALRRYRSVDMVPAIAVGAVAVFLILGVAVGNLAISSTI